MNRNLGLMTAVCGLVLAFGCAGTLKADAPQVPVAAPSPVPVKAGVKGELVGVGQGFRALPFPAVTDLGGQSRTFDSYNGKVLVLHFWASWCPYCRTEVDELKKLQTEDWKKQGVEVLTISTDQDLDKLRQFVKEQQLTYPVVADREQGISVGDQYGVSSIPVTLIMTRDGVIGTRLPGAGEIIEQVKQVLAESPAT